MHWVYILFVLLCVSHSAFCIAIYLQPPLVPLDEIEQADNTPSLALDDLMEIERGIQREIQRRALYSGRWFTVQRRNGGDESAGASKRARIGGSIVMGR